MDNSVITKGDGRLAVLFETIGGNNRRYCSQFQAGSRMRQYLTDRDLSKLLKISRRCLQDYPAPVLGV
jgi:hypothetical protein